MSVLTVDNLSTIHWAYYMHFVVQKETDFVLSILCFSIE